MNRHDFRYLERLRVRWAEVDMQKIVFNGHYLMYFDTAVAGYWRALALPYQQTMATLQGDLYVRKATLEYAGSARYDDVCQVGIRCGRIGNSSLVFQAAVFRGEQALVHGELVYVYADPATQTRRPVPDTLRAVLQGYEAGEAMLDIQLGHWAALQGAARPLREQVFVDEMGLPVALAEDAADAAAVQAVAFNRLGVAVACGRLLPPEAGAAQLGRLAVLPALRSSGIGAQLLSALVQAAADRGDPQVRLQAQADAVPLYQRAGFVSHGEPFEIGGLRHVEMARRL